MSLKQLRQDWEKGLCCFFEKEIRGIVNVLLKDEHGNYHLHRYFQNKGGWAVSKDIRGLTAEDAMKDMIVILCC